MPPVSYGLSQRSLGLLEGVHGDLVAVVRRAIELTTVDFTVIEGLRTAERQAELVRQGASRTMRSRHLKGADGYGHAVDLAAIHEGKVTWRSEAYRTLAPWVKLAARDLRIPIEWGGDWHDFVDMPHWQLPQERYP